MNHICLWNFYVRQISRIEKEQERERDINKCGEDRHINLIILLNKLTQ